MGAGLAGLTAAFTLAQHGVASTVYERSDRVGGRVHSYLGGYWSEGQVSEWCGELIDSDHATMRALAGLFGLTLVDMEAAEPPGASEAYFVRGAPYPVDQARADFTPVREVLARDVAESGAAHWAELTPVGRALDSMSVREWIESRVPGGTASQMGALLDVAYAAECAAETSDLSALSIVHALGYQPDEDGFSVLGESDERFHVAGGAELLPRAMAASLPDEIRHGWRLAAVEARPDGSVALGFEVGGAREAVVADHAILALPFAALRRVDCARAGFDDRKRAAIEELGAGRSAKLTLQFTERAWRDSGPLAPGSGTSYADTGYMCTWEPTRGTPGAAGILLGFSGGDVADAFAPASPYSDAAGDPAVASYARDLLAQLEPVFPGLAKLWNGKATLSAPMLDPCFGCSYHYYRVGQVQRFAGHEQVAAGNVHFTGEHCSQSHPGFMEGAASDGYRAACEVLSAL
ncbi:MAG: FAD-dependent oxidoreductase [Actinomycetota bacterium]|nr:FAD-dependent oxidoreductase [Actinomycetota bacterium]